jgi:hypothetical protein
MLDYEEYLEEDFIIWNSGFGVRDFVTIGKIEKNSDTPQAWLDEPYEMVGPFSLEELCTKGKISFAACVVMSKKRWQKDKIFLYEESIQKQRKEQFSFNEKVNKYNNSRRQYHFDLELNGEKKHRKILCLPAEGSLKISQIKNAFKIIAKKVHPDVGGSHEKFIKIMQARDALINV